MEDWSRIPFPKIPRTPGPDWACPSNPEETAKLFKISDESLAPEEVLPDGRSQLNDQPSNDV